MKIIKKDIEHNHLFKKNRLWDRKKLTEKNRNPEIDLLSDRGFTLLEVAVTVSLLLIALIPMENLFAAGIENSRRALELSRATDLAQVTMEELLSESPDSLGDGSALIEAEPPYPAYRMDYQSVEVDPELGLWKIGVEISWGIAGNEKECTASAYAAVHSQ